MYHKWLVSVVVVAAIFITVCGDKLKLPEDVCNLPEVTIACMLPTYAFHWRYDAGVGKCVRFGFGRCGVNENSFRSYEQCIIFCNGVQPDCSDTENEEDCYSE